MQIPMPVISYRGTPRTPEEWAALAKVGCGEPHVSRDDLRRLFMLGLVDRQLGRVCLSDHGRTVLGLQESFCMFRSGSPRAQCP